ncbi:hypothetical protein FNF31_07620 [Cafeteria roenbergensis]|uniref:SAC domain-containing protein n=1 Tax=Cafeteria roenbergensis TaxID=33653 RepID=A0A5A8D938_CAFRO|nr:hypothetical protein FNF31_07620 [Cafeteria roenbergensis]KAA0161167.1 hypothetical protein FNF28_05162 [Cafeteria roenbergensis]
MAAATGRKAIPSKLPELVCVVHSSGAYVGSAASSVVEGTRVGSVASRIKPGFPVLCLAKDRGLVSPSVANDFHKVEAPLLEGPSTEAIPCVAVLGVVPLTAGPYLLLVTGASTVASLPCGAVAWAIEAVRAVPLTLAATKVSSGADLLPWEVESIEDDAQLLAMLTGTLTNGSFVFATQYDATLTCQAIALQTAHDAATGADPFPGATLAGEAAAVPAPGAATEALAAEAAAALASPTASPLAAAPPAGAAFLPALRYRQSPAAPFGTTDLLRSDGRVMWNRWMLGGAPDGVGIAEPAGAAACTSPLIALPGLAAFVPPVAQGFIVSRPALTIGEPAVRVSLTVFSRRSCAHVGTRFFTRGVDEAGSPANAAETEQIVVASDGATTAFVQARGSIPVFWDQRPSLRWTPKVTVAPAAASAAAFRRHAAALQAAHGDGPVLAVCLIDRKGDQQMLGDAFGRACVGMLGSTGEGPADADGKQPYDQVSVAGDALRRNGWGYLWFDFHAECKGMRWGNLSKLLRAAAERVASGSRGGASTPSGAAPDLGVFRSAPAGAGEGGSLVLCLQRGVTRTNCMDNLDRTNVVQSLFARRAALLAASPKPWAPAARDAVTLWEATLAAAESGPGSAKGAAKAAAAVSTKGASAGLLASPFAGFERAFMNAWADNADAMSVLYSGTKALKTDFTRTGATSVQGRLADGWHAVSRWFLGNFQDGRTQDAWDVVTGAVRFQRARPGAPDADAHDADSAAASAAADSAAGSGMASTDSGLASGRSADGLGSAGSGKAAGGAAFGRSPAAAVRPQSARSAIRSHLSSVTPAGFLLRSALALACLAAAAASATAVVHGTALSRAEEAAGAGGGILAAAGALPWPIGASPADDRDASAGLLGAALAAVAGAARSAASAIGASGLETVPDPSARLTTGAIICGGAAAFVAMAAAAAFATKVGIPSAVVEPTVRRLGPKPPLDRKTCDFAGVVAGAGSGKAPRHKIE